MHYNPAVFFQGFLCYSFFYSIETVLEEKVFFFFCFRLPFKTEGMRDVTGCL